MHTTRRGQTNALLFYVLVNLIFTQNVLLHEGVFFFIVPPFSLRSFSLIFNLYAPHFLSYSYVINSAEFIKESFSSISGIFIDKPKKSFLGLIIAKVRYLDFQKKSHTVEVQIAMRYKRIEHFSDHLQINFHK